MEQHKQTRQSDQQRQLGVRMNQGAEEVPYVPRQSEEDEVQRQ